MSTQTPYEQIKFIHDAIKDRQDKNQPTFFSVKVERYGEITPMVNKEPGANFYETILQYLTKYDLSAIIIELYNGKAYNIKDPFQEFKLILKKSTDISLGNVNTKNDELKLTPTETIISPEKHFFTMAEKERQVMHLEYDIKRLQYENEELRRKNKKKKNYIAQLEADIGKTEKEKKNSFANVALGMVGANALEGFAKSSFGLGLLKDGFGVKPEVLDGLLGSPESKEAGNEIKSTARVIVSEEQTSKEEKQPLTENQKIRENIKKSINEFLDKSNDAVLRNHYELITLLGSDLETLLSILGQVKAYREKQKAFIEQKMKDASNSSRSPASLSSGKNDDSNKEKKESDKNDDKSEDENYEDSS